MTGLRDSAFFNSPYRQVQRQLRPGLRVRTAARLTAVSVVSATLVAAPGSAWATADGAKLLNPTTPSVSVHQVAGKPAHLQRYARYTAPSRVQWPAGIVDLGASSYRSGIAQAGRMPIWISSADRAPVHVDVLSQTAVDRAGLHGLLMTVTPTSQGGLLSPLRLTLNYSSLSEAYGGDWASRLQLATMPSCVLTTPQVAACRVLTPIPSRNNAQSQNLIGTLPINEKPADAGTATSSPRTVQATVVAATAPATGGAGSYASMPMKPAQSWAEGGSSGAFEDSYPFAVPPVPGGLAPTVGLNYNSQAVDGDTSATNNQASQVGDGWDMSNSYIQRSFQSCSVNPAGSTKTGDECWSANNVDTLSLNGQSTQLVNDSSTGWHALADHGERITYCTGSSTTGGCLGATVNGTQDNGYWVVTTLDGTRYVFGMNELPGYATATTKATTNSAWTVPVYATASGQPCYNATFSLSVCPNTAWRWNLDYVVDTHNDAESYWYAPETNYYSPDLGTTATAASLYDRGGYLSKIDYGQRSASIFSATPAAEINFTYTGRCTALATSPPGSCPVSGLSSTTASQWPDVPYAQICASGKPCSNTSPSFFSEYALTTIATSTLKGSTLTAVDKWSLTHTFPATNDASSPNPSLWLASVTHMGEDGTEISLPPTNFTPTMYANRVHTTDGYSLITRPRLTQIKTETGAVETITYTNTISGVTPCSTSVASDESANTQLCYPSYWLQPGGTTPVEDWFNKYVVNAVSVQDPTAGQSTVQTNYAYAAPAWFEDLSPVTPTGQRTWNSWRGFKTVTTTTGTAPDPITETIDTYFQGMNGNPVKGGGTSPATLTDSRGDTGVVDNPALDGVKYESRTFNGNGGSLISDTINTPWISPSPTGKQTYSGLPTFNAVITGIADAKTYTTLAAGGPRLSETATTYGATTGLPLTVSSVPDSTVPKESTCTTNTYISNADEWLLDLIDETQVVNIPCGQAATLPTNAVSDTRMIYDQGSFGSTPTVGDLTTTLKAASYAASTPSFVTTDSATVDQYGRALTATDADGRVTKTAYTPATGAEPTTKSVTSPMGLVTTTTMDPARDLVLTTTDPAGYVATSTYDALGRTTASWNPGVPTSQAADTTDSYSISQTAPSVMTTKTLGANGTYRVNETLYDSELRAVEAQTATPDGGRDITDQTYNSDGWVIAATAPYYNASAPSATLVEAPANQVPSEAGYTYDGAGRKLAAIAYHLATETWRTSYTYGGNFVTTVPPTGGTPTTLYTDALGRNVELLQYHSGVPIDPVNDPSSDYDATTYSYDYANTSTSTGTTNTVTNATGEQWTQTYDLLGHQTTGTDPDTGKTVTSYDNAGQLLSATDARQKTVSYTYDLDGRKTAAYDTTGGVSQSGTHELDSWTYDSVKKGLPAISTSYTGGTSGTAYTTSILAYNSLGKVSAQRVTIPAVSGVTTSGSASLAGSYTFTYGYAANGQPTTQTEGAANGLPGETITTGYNNYDEPNSLGSATQQYVTDLSYNEVGQPSLFTFGPSTSYVQDQLQYDPQTSRVTSNTVADSTSTGLVDQTNYAYDAFGNPTSATDSMGGSTPSTETQCYRYDYLDRLTTAWSATDNCAATPSSSSSSTVGGATPYWEGWTYDADGNRKTQTVYNTAGNSSANVTTTYAYPTAGSSTDQPHAVATVTSTDPTVGTTSYGYDPSGNTTTINNPTLPSANQTLTWSTQGQARTDTTSAGTTSYTYDANGSLLIDAAPGLTTLYVGDDQYTLNTSTGTTSGTRFYSLAGATIATRTSSGTIAYLVSDPHGSASIAIDASTQSVTRRLYDPFGVTLSGSTTFPTGQKGFIGGNADTSTGLENLGAREYAPSLGRFVSVDPLLESDSPQQLNGYAYAGNNPVASSDPTGLDPGIPACSGTAAQVRACRNNSYSGNPSTSTGGGRTATSPPPRLPSNIENALSYQIRRAGPGYADRVTRSFLNEEMMAEGPAASSQIRAYYCYHYGGGDGLCGNESVGDQVNDVLDFGMGLAMLTGVGDLADAGIAGIRSLTAARDAARIASRTDELTGVLDPIAQTRRTSAVMSTREGTDVLAGGGTDLSPAQRALSGGDDILGRLPRAHAEITAMDAAAKAGLTPWQMAVSRVICPACQTAIEESGGTVAPGGFFAWWPR